MLLPIWSILSSGLPASTAGLHPENQPHAGRADRRCPGPASSATEAAVEIPLKPTLENGRLGRLTFNTGCRTAVHTASFLRGVKYADRSPSERATVALTCKRSLRVAELAGLLQQTRARLVIDVRAIPRSRINPELRGLGCAHICVVMCAEAVWGRCHRRIIADCLISDGKQVFHVMGPGRSSRPA